MTWVFRIERFIEWCRRNGSEIEVNEILQSKDWERYEGMTLEEVKQQEKMTIREWFAKEKK